VDQQRGPFYHENTTLTAVLQGAAKLMAVIGHHSQLG